MRSHLVCISVSLLLCLSSAASAACAPPPPVFDETKKVDTAGAIGKFLKLAGLDLRVDVAAEKKAIFSEYPNADQMVVALTTIHNVCAVLENSTQISDREKIDILVSLQVQFFSARAVGPQPISSTATSKRETVPSPPQEQPGGEKKSQRMMPVQLVAMRDGPAGSASPKVSWADIYLNPVPIFITDKNKYFVIVASASTEGEGTKRLSELKSTYPAYDFELYAPYGSNRSYGIMIASWVSRERANEALGAAKKIEPTSFIWSCRGTGEEC
jgi:hypothetical protein